MKKILLFVAIVLPTIIFAQGNEGEITFNHKIKFKIDLPEGQEDLAAMFPSEQNFKKTLLFTQDQSIFMDKKQNEEEGADGVIEAGNEEVQIKIITTGTQKNKLYKNLKNHKFIQKEDFFGKTFLINGEIEQPVWKLSGQQKKILNYNCQQASYMDGETTITAWFTTEIPVPNGPKQYGNLPGMILEVIINDGEELFTAEAISFRKIKANEIKAPKKGKKVSAEKFDKIVETKMKEMEEEMGGGTGIKIKID